MATTPHSAEYTSLSYSAGSYSFHCSMNFLKALSLRASCERQKATSRAGFGVDASAASANLLVNLSASDSVCLSLSMNPRSRVMILWNASGASAASPESLDSRSGRRL